MKDKKDIKEKMLELYSTESSIEREKVQDIIFLDNLKFKPYNAMAEFSQADLFIVKKQNAYHSTIGSQGSCRAEIKQQVARSRLLPTA